MKKLRKLLRANKTNDDACAVILDRAFRAKKQPNMKDPLRCDYRRVHK